MWRYFIGVNVLTVGLYAQDKLSAMGWMPISIRIPELAFHQLEIMGGSPGSFVAQRVFRHKISKTSYLQRFSIVLLLQTLGGIAWAYYLYTSWEVLCCSAASAMMLAETAFRIRYIGNWRNRSESKGGVKSWQQPVSYKAATRRQPFRQARSRPYRGHTP